MCKWSKVLFVEFPEQIEVFRDILGSFEEYKVISLTPHASLSLELSGIPYSIIADYFNEKDIEEFGIHTTAQVNSMISLIDDFLQANIPEFTDTQFRPAWFAGYFLKKLYDSVALRSYELNHVLKALGPVELLYSKPVTDDFEDNLNWKELSLYSHVFRLISAQSDLKSVELEFDYTSVSSTNPLTYQAQEHETRVGGPAGNPLIDRLRHIAKQNPYAVKYYRWLRQQYQGMATGVRWLTPRAHSLGKEPDTVPPNLS